STDFTATALASGVELEPVRRLEGVRVVGYCRLGPTGGPTDGKDIETGGVAQQMVALEIVEGHARQPPLLLAVHGRGGLGRVGALGRAHLDEDEAVPVAGDQVELAQRAREVVGEEAVAEPLQVAPRGALGARAEPAPP